jgi:TonB-dependent starch-binding outer membrane protein SusC
MKQILLFPLIFIITINYSFGQKINDNLKTDSIGIVSPNKVRSNEISGYSSKIGYNDFNRGAISSPMQLIQGKVPGFVVNCLNVNDPNPDLQIQSRGISTLILSTEPLYIIDGIPLESPDIIPVENIDSIEVLKSLYETAPYGIRGVNGVVIIKTKKSSSQKLTVSYNTYIYSEIFAKKSDYMSAAEWQTLKQNWASSTYHDLVAKSNEMSDYNANTDWRKEISQNKLSQAHNLGFFGGYKKTRYSAMLNYNNYNGIIQKTGNATYSGQLSISQLALKDKLQVDISLIGTDRKYSEINDNPYLTVTDSYTGLKKSNIISIANHYNPTVPVYNTDGTYGIDIGYDYTNPFNKIINTMDKRESKNTLVHIQASYEIIKGLKFSASWSEFKTATENSFSYYYQPSAGHQYLAETKETNNPQESLSSVKANYRKSIAFHYFDISLNYSIQKNDINYNYGDSVIIDGTQINSRHWITSYGNYNIENLSGSFKYNYKSKYYLSFGILRETSPLYTSSVAAQYFPSLSAEWSLGNEIFLTNITWLNELKLRAGYGLGQRMIKPADNSAYKSSIIPNGCHGENMQELNMGVDVSLLSNRLCFSADYYNRKTKDGAILLSVMYFTYINNEVEIHNKGWEFYIKAQPVKNQLKWMVDFNISFNRNIGKSEYFDNYGTTAKDQPIGNFYGHKFAGYSATNQMLLYDDNGNATTNSIANSKLGNGAPKSFFGFTNNFEYKNFDLSIFMRGALGFEIANFNKLESYGFMNHKKTLLLVDQRNIINFLSLQTTDYIIEKGDYIKIATIFLGYTIPIEKRFFKSAKVYIACNNAALFTKASDIDPEMAGITGLYPGNYYYKEYPETRIFLLGLKVLF